MTYDNIKSHKKTRIHSLSRKYNLYYPPAFLEVKNLGLSNENFMSFKEVSLSVLDQ